MTREELEREYEKLAAAANRRLQRLVELSREPGYSKVLSYAYAGAMEDIKAMQGRKKSGEYYTRFKKKTPGVSNRELQKRINIIRDFMHKPSATPGGIKNIYRKRANTINEEYGTNIDWQDLADIFESGLYDSLYGFFGESKIVMKAIATIDRSAADLRKMFEENKDLHFSGELGPDLVEWASDSSNKDILFRYLGGHA